jgi:hypothetical protein
MGVKNVCFAMLIAVVFLAGFGTAKIQGPQFTLPTAPQITERPSPSSFIPEENIHIYDDRIVIDIDDPQWAIFADTNSMDPVIDQGMHGLQIVPKDSSQLKVGDIVSFTHAGADDIIIHRIIQIGADEDGWYAITKGDNTQIEDGKIRFEQIHRVLVGILY